MSIETRLSEGAAEARRVAASFDRPGVTSSPSLLPRRLAVAVVAGAAVIAIVVAGIWATTWVIHEDEETAAADQPVLEVRLVPAPSPIGDPLVAVYSYAEGPVYTVFLDGHMIVGHPWAPETMLRVPSVVDIGTDVVADVIATAEAVGLPEITTEVDEGAVDPLYGTSQGMYWTFRYRDEAGIHELAVFSLDTAAELLQNDRYTALYDLYAQLATLAYDAPALGDMPIERIEVMVGASVQADSVSGFEAEPWPLDGTVAELPEYVDGIRCTVVTGPNATGLSDLLTSLPADTPFLEGDQWHQVIARALVPGEPGCRLPGN